MIDLFEEEIMKPKEKKGIKPTTVMLVFIIILAIVSIAMLGLIFYIKGTILTMTIDGMESKNLEEILIIQEDNKVYMPIRRMAQYLNYDVYNGDYITLSEDESKCYIETDEELVSFTLNSDVITKVIEGETYEAKINEPIQKINEELCITSEGAEEAFNLKFYYDTANNKIVIQTLSYLYTAYSQHSQNKGYAKIEQESFINKIAILDGMLIVKSSNGYYGVVAANSDCTVILEPKYDSIEYFRETSEFLVGSNDKYGIISTDKSTKVRLIYDSIEKITDEEKTYYVVKQSNLYGLLDSDGNTIIYPEYEQVGIDVKNYLQNGVTNGYVLYNKIIPVKQNNKWAIFDIDGNKITDFIYDSLGSTSINNSTRTYGVLEVPEYNLLVVSQNNKYNLIKLDGSPIFSSYVLDSVYITISEGKNIYYITSGENTKELISFLEENNVEKPTEE